MAASSGERGMTLVSSVVYSFLHFKKAEAHVPSSARGSSDILDKCSGFVPLQPLYML